MHLARIHGDETSRPRLDLTSTAPGAVPTGIDHPDTILIVNVSGKRARTRGGHRMDAADREFVKLNGLAHGATLFHRAADGPVMTKRILQLAVAHAPELIIQRHQHLRA